MQHEGLIGEIDGAYAELRATAEALAAADREHSEHVRRVRIDNADAILEAKNERAERLYGGRATGHGRALEA